MVKDWQIGKQPNRNKPNALTSDAIVEIQCGLKL